MAKILVAEDSTSTRMVLEKFLKNAGYEVVCAKDGLEAHSLFLKTTPDLVLTDNKMPIMTGLELMLRLRKEGYLTPIILTSSDSVYFQGYLDELVFFKKPIAYRKLLFMLDAWIGNKIPI